MLDFTINFYCKYFYKIFITKNFDIKCILTSQRVCFQRAMKHENYVSNMIGCLQVVRIYSFMKEIRLYSHALFIYRLSLR